MSGDLIRPRNRSKLVKRSLCATIGLLQGAKYILLYFVWRVGDDFHKNFKVLEKIYFLMLFYFFEFLNVITAPETLKGSQNIQGFALIRAVLLFRLRILK